MNEFSIVHLVWGPLGPEPVKNFVASLRDRPAGREYELVILLNGVADGATRDAIVAELEGVAYRLLETPEPSIDLAAYRWALDRIDAEKVIFLNSYSRFEAAGWLDLLDRALDMDGVGMVGATGTWESIGDKPFNWRMPWTKFFPGFPNAHLRTTAFLLEAELARSIRWRPPKGKIAALGLESGRRSISNQVKSHGLELRVVGRDGRSFAEADWKDSGTYRSGRQQNLLIADNRTDDFLAATPAEREALRRLAWG
ncbi:MAG: hypothetical protein QM648_06060 [Solirubrobacterales bacterium]